MTKVFDASWTENQAAERMMAGLPVSSRRRAARWQPPIRQILLFALAVFAFKIFLFLDLGGAAYGSKMNALSEGAFLERVAAGAMVMDPVSEWIVNGIRFGIW